MGRSEERIQILKMLESGQITAEEAARLLEAIAGSSSKQPPEEQAGGPRWFRVRVTDLATGRSKVNVNLPMGLVNVGLRMGANFAPKVAGVDAEQILDAIRSGVVGKIAEIEDNDDGERIEIFVE